MIVAARNEGERIGATLGALAEALPGARLIVADDASTDATPMIGPLVDAIEDGVCDLAVAAFADPSRGGFGIALGVRRAAGARR